MGIFRKILAITLIVCLLCPAAVLADNDMAGQTFSDVKTSDWFYEFVTNVCEKGIFSGVTETSFEPNSPITRAMFVTALGRLSGADISVYTESSFADVKTTDWYAPFVEWSYKNGIANGTEADAFSPNAPISREQAATFIQRFFDCNKFEVSTNAQFTYGDSADISSYAQLAVTVCSNAGIISGYDDGTFKPKGNITRAESAVVMTKLEEYISLNNKKGRIFNSEDRKKIQTAIIALDKPIKEDIYLARDIYFVAFSKSFSVTGSGYEILNKAFGSASDEQSALIKEMVAEGLYGGTKAEDVLGEKKNTITSTDFVTGDIIIYQNSIADNNSVFMYIYNGKQFSLLKYETRKESVKSVVDAALASDRFVVLRPSYAMPEVNDSLPYKEEEMNDFQKAIVETAENYLLRGYRIQYADTRFSNGGEFRWQSAVKAPEDYTIDEHGYTNCAAFATDVHRMATGWVTELNTTASLMAEESLRVFYYQPTGKETDEEKQKIEDDFNKRIVPGDIIVIRRPNNSGHAMLYTGNGNIIHSTGSTYNYETGVESYEPSIRYLQLKDLFTPQGGEKRYVFGGIVNELGIIRPKSVRKERFPEASLKRLENLKGIVAEKLSSHKQGMTVNPGEEMTFTFSVSNTNNYSVSFDISDSVPSNTSYISGAEKVDGDKLSWNITVPAGEAKQVSFTVKVNETASENSTVHSDSGKINGVPVNCADIYIKKTLTKEEQAKLKSATESLPGKNPVENANAVYSKAFGTDNILKVSSLANLEKELFEQNTDKADTFRLKASGELVNAVAPSLFGGRLLFSNAYDYREKGTYYRTRLVKEQGLIAGDIIATYTNSGSNLYIYTGDSILDLTTGKPVDNTTKKFLDSLLSTELYFAVLRPSVLIK